MQVPYCLMTLFASEHCDFSIQVPELNIIAIDEFLSHLYVQYLAAMRAALDMRGAAPPSPRTLHLSRAAVRVR